MNKILLIINMQEGFRKKESEKILPNIIELKKYFKEKIIFCNFVNKKNSQFEKQLNWKKFQTKKDQELFIELASSKNIKFKHEKYSILTKKLKKFIKKNKISKVFLVGIYTDVCIMNAAMQFFDEGIETYIIEDACNSLHGKENHIFAIDSLKHILGEDHILKIEDISTKRFKI